jgi:hypothetical protein
MLPATYGEAIETEPLKPLEFARQHIAYVKAGKLQLWGIVPGRWFDGAESERMCRAMLAQWALRDTVNLMNAVELARGGFELWQDVLRDMILEYQNGSRDGDMPIYLRAYAMELTAGAHHRRKGGRHRAGQLLRNLIIATIIAEMIERFGIRPTRNVASHRPSLCSIMAQALALEGMAMGEPNVVQIWRTEGRRLLEMRQYLQ